MTRPILDLNPVRTGSEMKFATKPRRMADASNSSTPTSTASVAEAVTRSAPPPGATRASSAPVRMASVVVVLTLSTREVPSRAYTTIGTLAV